MFGLLLRNQFDALKALADLEALSLSDPAILMFIDYLLTNRSSFQHARKRSAQDTNLRKVPQSNTKVLVLKFNHSVKEIMFFDTEEKLVSDQIQFR